MSVRYFDGPEPPRGKLHDGARWRDSETGASWRWRSGRGWVRFVDRRAKNKWKRAELAILRTYYPVEGVEGCAKRLPRRVARAIECRARELRLRSPNGPRGLQTALAGDELEEAIQLHQAEKWGFERIGQEFGVSEGAAANAVLMALGRRAGYTPAERDENGDLTDRGIEQLRLAMRKGWKGVDIVRRLAVSAGTVSGERRRYATYLKANRKAPLPPPGGGQEYAGRKHPKERLREVERLFLAGEATPAVSDKTGVSRTQCGRIRNRLVKRLAKKGKTLPGCDRKGKRLTYPNTVIKIPPGTFEKLEHLLLVERMTVRAAADELALGHSSAYRYRDLLKARLEAEGKELPPPLPWRGRKRQARAAAMKWLPPGRINKMLYRRFLRQLGEDEAEARRRTVRAIAERDGQDPGLAEMLDRLKRGAVAVEKVVPWARPIGMTLAAVASGALA